MHLVALKIKIKGKRALIFFMLISGCTAQSGVEHHLSNDGCRGLEVLNKLAEMC